MKRRELNYRSVHELNQSVIRWSRDLPQNVELIVGIPRSGLLAASLLSLHMHRPLCDLTTYLSGAEPWGGFRRATGAASGITLLVDDTSHTGQEMDRVKAAVRAAGKDSASVLYGAVYITASARPFVDTFAEVLPHPRAFEWNILNHPRMLSRACMDIDGVLCPDPADRDNDDGPRYRRFLSDTELRYRPSFKVHSLVTSRLEKYRPETEEWLARHGVEYGELIMLDLPTAAERRRLGAHATHKAAAYAASGNELFIESERDQGKRIHELTGLPVYVTDTRDFFGAGGDPNFREPWQHRAADAARRILRR
ncbi:phosphoribosyltransferase [Planctomonas psychrotolerans]|uniref:phosphoribosyltransferase n=1 Tax=Planctomonas psychrotolerans TaxID=2528712 RepID=UPI00123A66F9|nr:phosphoribosyltransferase [Planctomonas psychrotolerans]